MLQKAKVIRLIDDNTAEISVVRESACGHDCASCGGCASASAQVKTEALNLAHASVGDFVTIETDTTAVIGVAAVVYMLPLVLFFAFYITLKAMNFADVLCVSVGVAGFICGIVLAMLLNRHVDRKKSITYKIISINPKEK